MSKNMLSKALEFSSMLLLGGFQRTIYVLQKIQHLFDVGSNA